MTTTTIEGHTIHVNEEGFLTDPSEWSEELAETLASQIGITLTEEHRQVIRFLRQDFDATGETATLRRLAVVGQVPTKTMFRLFPQKPAKKAAYVAGLPKPRGCV